MSPSLPLSPLSLSLSVSLSLSLSLSHSLSVSLSLSLRDVSVLEVLVNYSATAPLRVRVLG